MTRFLVAALAGLVTGLSAAPDPPAAPSPDRVAVVVDASGPGAQARIAAARDDADARNATFRAPRTLHDQLSVTSRLAAENHTTIVGYGLEAYASVDPLPDRVRYIAAD